MALINAVRQNPFDPVLEIWKWAGMAAGDTANYVVCALRQDKTVYWKATTPGTAVLSFEGTPDLALGSALSTPLHDTRGFANALTPLTMVTTFTAVQVLELAWAVRPVLTGGATTAGLEVWLVMKGD